MSSDVNPYASPQAEHGIVAGVAKPNPYTPSRVRPFQPADSPGRIAVALIVVAMLIEAAGMVYRYADAQMLRGILDGQKVSQVEAETNSVMILFAERAHLLVTIAAAIPYWIWSYRSHRNLPALLAGSLSFSPGWAIGGWFLPFGNLVIPYQIVQEIHRGSAPLALERPTASRLGPASLFAVLWWCCWIACAIVALVGVIVLGTQTPGSPDLQSLLLGVWLLLAASVLRLGAGIFIIQVILNAIRDQRDRHAIVERMSSKPVVATAAM